MKFRWKQGALSVLTAASLLLSGCAAGQPQPAPTEAPAPTATSAVPPDAEATSNVGFFFDTVVTIKLYGAPEGLMDELLAQCARYELLLSKTREGSDVWRLNAANGEPVAVDPETWQILRRAKEISAQTGHAFSVTIAPLTALWDFTGGTNRKPTEAERLAALPLVNDEGITLWEDGRVSLLPGQQIDLGGIAKGYIADRLAEICRERGVPALLNFGGNVYAEGIKPNNEDWVIGIRDPQGSGSDVRVLVYAKDCTVVTSGTYERFFVEDGVLYHHILDPQTGLPAQTDLAGASIVGGSSMDADAYATACIVLGREKAMEFLTENGLSAILIDTDNRVTVTPALEVNYTWIDVAEASGQS